MRENEHETTASRFLLISNHPLEIVRQLTNSPTSKFPF